jgi:hypothetical protein
MTRQEMRHLNHELARLISIKFGNGPEEAQGVPTVDGIEGVHKAYVDKGDLGNITVQSEHS